MPQAAYLTELTTVVDVFDALRQRHSVRRFLSQSIKQQVLREIVDAARFAPSAHNSQPWEFVVVTNAETLRALAELAPNAPFLEAASAVVAVFCRRTDHFVEGGAAATENLLLAATGKGIGSCWIPGLDMPYEKAVAKLLRARGHLRLLSLVALGYEAESATLRPPKRLLEDMLHWESF